MFVSHQHQKIIVPYRPDIQALFPSAQRLEWEGNDLIAVRHGTEETRMLRNLQIDAPAPIQEHYQWTGYHKPFLVQVKTAAMMTTNPRAYVLNGMGTGKTKAALWSFDWLKSQGEARRMLVIAPLSTLSFVWQRECMETVPHLKVSVLHGSADKRRSRLAEDADIYIINHDGVGVIKKELILRGDIDVFCVDEVAAYRNNRAIRSKTLQQIVRSRRWVWGMTGSPTPSSPTDAYGLAKLITPERAPRSFMTFRYDTMVQINQFRWVPRNDAAKVVANLLQPAVRFTLEEVVELPELIERPFDVIQGPRQRAAYLSLKNEAVAMLQKGMVTAVNGGVLFTKLIQVSCGYVYEDGGGYEILDNEMRLEAMHEIIDGAVRKIIIFAPFIHATKGISDYLTKEKITHRVVTGDTPRGERDKIFNSFQRTAEFDVLVAHPGCMAHGLTLTSADTIIWFAPITSLEIFEQANARITRVGQCFKQQVFMLAGTPAERAVYTSLRAKRAIQDGILDLLAEATS